ncbi:znf593 [Symbiodinium sp. KB8]|nr:znf593 [Symbiodinium sp. KB8]
MQCSAVLPTPFKLRRVCRRGQQCLWEQGSPRSCDSSGSMAPGKTKHKHGHHSKKKRHKWKIGLELKKRTKDHDQIHEQVQLEAAQGSLDLPIDYDLPGAGQHYCTYCDRYFTNNDTLSQHTRSKAHRRRKRNIDTEKPYTQAEADAAAGMAPPDTAKDQSLFYARAQPQGAALTRATAAAAAATGGADVTLA